MKKIRAKSIVMNQDNDDGVEYRGKLPGFKGINYEVKTETKVVKNNGNISYLFLMS